MKILTVLGARPQFIKAAVVSREIKNYKDIKEIIVHTGQHYDYNMSDIFFEEMQIPKPDYFLGVGGKLHGEMLGEMIIKLEEVVLKEKPDWILVYGDTNSTLAGAMVSSKLQIKLAHIEAGLRSFNMKMPEEINRVLTDRVSNILFCPTDTAVNNLKKEGFPFKMADGKYQEILKVGDVMYDALIYYKKFAKKPEQLEKYNFSSFILATIHRAENTDNIDRLKNIFEAFKEISKEIPIILPLHPRTKKILKNAEIDIKDIVLIEPVSYLEMMWLLDNCKLVMTDSGGLQKEAYWSRKLCITLREETEWVELVEIGVNYLAGEDKKKILKIFNEIKSQDVKESYKELFGSGNTKEMIVKKLKKID